MSPSLSHLPRVPRRPISRSVLTSMVLAACWAGPFVAMSAAQIQPPGAPGPRPGREPKTGEEAVAVEVAVVGEARPGAEVRVAVTLDVIPGWHVYWSNPGESGSATSIALELPEGCAIERPEGRSIDFPVPMIFRKGETTFGYEGSVTLSIPVRLPDAIPAGGLPVKVRSRWLVCKERCLMGSNAAEVDLARPAAKDSPAAVRVSAALGALPKPLPTDWRISVERTSADLAVLSVVRPDAAGPLTFIPDDTPGVVLASGYLAETKEGPLRTEISIHPENAGDKPLEAAGILVVGKTGQAYAFRVPVPESKP